MQIISNLKKYIRKIYLLGTWEAYLATRLTSLSKINQVPPSPSGELPKFLIGFLSLGRKMLTNGDTTVSQCCPRLGFYKWNTNYFSQQHMLGYRTWKFLKSAQTVRSGFLIFLAFLAKFLIKNHLLKDRIGHYVYPYLLVMVKMNVRK